MARLSLEWNSWLAGMQSFIVCIKIQIVQCDYVKINDFNDRYSVFSHTSPLTAEIFH